MKEGTLYRRILREAVDITWKYKALWLLGFLAVFWGDVGAYRAFNRTFGQVDFFSPTFSLTETFSAVSSKLSPGAFATAIILVLFILAIIATFFVLVTAARGGLIFAIAERGARKVPRPSQSLRRGLKAFWPLLGIGILSRLDVPLYMLLLRPFLDLNSTPVLLVLYVGAFIVVTLLSVILSLLGMYAAAAVMLKGATFKKAILESLRLFEKHWLVSLEMGLLLYLITFLVGVVALFILFVLGLPFFFLGVVSGLLNATYGVWLAIGAAGIIYLIFLLLAGSAFITFQYAAWVLLYRRLSKEGAQSKLVRLTSRFAHIFHRKVV